MTQRWQVIMAIAALVLVASAVWLLAGLLGDGISAGPVVGLALGLLGLLWSRLQWLMSRGAFYADYEDEDTDEEPEAWPTPAVPPVTRGWDGASGTHTASGGRDVLIPDWLKESEFKDKSDASSEPSLLPAAPQPESEPMPDAAETARPAAPILFSAYYPREVKPDDWQPLRAYMYKDFVAEAVKADARAQFGPRADIRATAREALQPVPDDALVTALPSVPGLEFDPPQLSLRFRGDWRRFDFDFRAHNAPLDTGVDGRITFLVEGMIVADVPISVYVSQTAGEAALQPREATVSPYQAIFCSYSHQDTAIVERVERASRYFNFRYLRDVTTLRSGEAWNARLLELIDSADIFQLFWSKHAAESAYVRQEYQHAIELRRRGVKVPTFIRPIRWEEPMPVPPPPELAELHFDLILELAQER